MRDPSRIFPLVNEVAALWMEHCPDLRFCQLMSNFMSRYGGAFYMEDDQFLALFRRFLTADGDPVEEDEP